MVEVTLYRNMRKDINSTARPGTGDFDSSTIYSCELFEPCSVQAPKILIATALGADIHNFNYAYIPHFSRYYWVTDLSFLDGRWLITLSCDVLASFKNEIAASEQYILRSESVYNENIRDTLYVPAGAPIQTVQSNLSGIFADEITDGGFIVGVTSQSAAIGSNLGTTYYIYMSPTQIAALANILMSNPQYLGMDPTEISDSMTKAILNPIQYIQSVKWFPCTMTGAQEYILYFGWWSVNTPSGYAPALSSSDVFVRTFTFNLTKHPQAATLGSYLNLAPYSKYELELPCMGRLELPADLLYNAVYVTIGVVIDKVTGMARISVTAGDEAHLEWEVLTTSAEMAMDIPLAQLTNNAVGALKAGVSGVSGAVGGLLSGNIIGGITSLVTGGIDATIAQKTPIPEFMGVPGNIAQFRVPPTLFYTYIPMTGPAFNLFGRPLCEKRVINTLDGFTMCGRAHLAIPGATKAETEEAERYLNEGFRYE